MKEQRSIAQRLTKSTLPFNTYLFLFYSQKCMWNIYEESLPMRDLNFNPGIGLAKHLFVKNRYIGCTFITPDQRSRCISYVLQLCKQREKLEFRLISGRIVNDFQYVADPNMFLSGAASYLRLDNNCPINRIAMVNNSVMEDRLSEYFDQVWNLDDQNVTKERNAIAEHIHHVLQGIHLITRAKSDEMEELQESWMIKI